MKINLASNEIIHFIGIGGIGMSGLAQIMKNMGFNVRGSDLNYNKNVDVLKKFKIPVFIGHHKRNIDVPYVFLCVPIKTHRCVLIFWEGG